MSEAPERLWIWFADREMDQPLHIRQWQSTPFGEGTEYVRASIARKTTGEATTVKALETALRSCRTFVIACRAEAKGRNANRYDHTNELVDKIDVALSSTMAATPSNLRNAIRDIVRKFEFGSAIPEHVADAVMAILPAATPQEPVPAPEEAFAPSVAALQAENERLSGELTATLSRKSGGDA